MAQQKHDETNNQNRTQSNATNTRTPITTLQIGKYYSWEDSKGRDKIVIIQVVDIRISNYQEWIYVFKIKADTASSRGANIEHERCESTIQIWIKENNFHEITEEEAEVYMTVDGLKK